MIAPHILFITLLLCRLDPPVSDLQLNASHGLQTYAVLQDNHSHTTLMLILCDDDFLCPVCRIGFQSLCDTLQQFASAVNIYCILEIIRHKTSSSIRMEENIHIITKQCRGFLLGLGAYFPIIFDDERVFMPEKKERSLLIMVHPMFSMIKKWPLPLTLSDLQELSFFLRSINNG